MSRRKPSTLSLTDLFCGAGGASIGAEAAGLKLALGVNHWQRAVDTHSTNFPDAAHDCRDISETHPSRYQSTHLLWASPECPTWSQARGKRRNFSAQLDAFEPLPTEAEEKSRVTMWDVVRYAEYHDYEAVVVENVVDLMPWYLLPVWLQAMDTLGYQHQALFLNSMFFGVPQSRDRVYFVFWKKGNRAPDLAHRPRSWCPSCAGDVEASQVFKKAEKAAGRYRAQYIYVCPICHREAFPYVMPAAIAIDWTVRGERIGDRKRALAPATIARIQAGIDRYWRRPVILDTLRAPKLRDAAVDPLATQTARQSQGLVTHLRGTEKNQVENSALPTDDPLRTITGGGNHHGLVEPPEALYIKNFTARGNPGQMAHPISEPLGSITSVDHHSLLQDPLVVAYYGREHTARPIGLPFSTITGDPRHGLLVPAGGTRRRHASETGVPMPTRTSTENDGLVSPPIVVPLDQRGPGRGNKSRTVAEPLRTQTSIQADGLITPPLVVKAAGSTHDPGKYKRVRTAEDPLWTQTSTNETGIVAAPEALLDSYYGAGGPPHPTAEPMGTVTSKQRHALINGEVDIAVDDCFFRMLMPPEIQLGMGFVSEYTVLGNQRERVQQLGQAVTPPVPLWIWTQILASLA